MKAILYDGEKEGTKKEVLERLDYFINLSKQGMKMYEQDKKATLDLAKQIRKELELEHHNNGLTRIIKLYKRNEYFQDYKRYVHRAFVSITGNLSYKNLFSFLYDVGDYLDTYKCQLEYQEKLKN